MSSGETAKKPRAAMVRSGPARNARRQSAVPSSARQPHSAISRSNQRSYAARSPSWPSDGKHEHRQRARRVLELEVAIRNGAERNGVAVALVDAGVGDLVAAEEAVVEQGPGRNEDAERDDDDERRRRARQKGPRAV